MSPRSTRESEVQRTFVVGLTVLVFLAYWLAASVLLHFIRPDMDPFVRTMSEYVVGPNGWIMTTTFFALALAITAVAVGIQRSLAPSGGKSVGVGLLLAASAGIAVAGIFPGLIGPPQPPPPYDQATMSAYIEEAGPMHDVGSMVAFLSLAVALPLLSHRLSQEQHWIDTAGLAQALAYLFVGGLIALFIIAGVVGSGLLGLVQRIIMAAMIAWMIVVARRLVQRERAP